MLAGYPAQMISAAVAATPPASISAGTRRPRSEPSAQAMPSRYGTSQPAGRLIQPTQEGPDRPNLTRSATATTPAVIPDRAGALPRVLAEPAATAVASAAFGVWHIRPTAEALAANRLATAPGPRIAAVSAVAAGSAAAGALLSVLRDRSGSLAAP
jgi:hypothetical protein